MSRIFKLAVSLVLFLVVFLFFFWLSNFDKFADPDSFYHVKMTELLMDGKVFRAFPFLPFTTLADAFSDQHFVYHLFTAPFFLIFANHLLAAKIAANLFAAAVFILFYWLLGKLKVRGRIFYLLVLLSSSTFVFRMNSPKAGVLSLILILLLFWFILRKKYALLFLCSYVWVLTHGSWPLAIVMAVSFVLARNFYHEVTPPVIPASPSVIPASPSVIPASPSVIPASPSVIPAKAGIQNNGILDSPVKLENDTMSRRRINFEPKLFFSVIFGIVAGLVINPYFPQNILFNWVQIFQVGVLNYGYKIGVGSEWYPPSFWELVSSTGLLFPLFLFALTLFLMGCAFKKDGYLLAKDDVSKVLFSGIFLVFVFVLALKSRRNIEYFAPIGVIFSSLVSSIGIMATDFKRIEEILRRKFIKCAVFLATVFFLVCSGYIVFHNLSMVRSNFKNGFSWGKFKDASEFIKNNSGEPPPSPHVSLREIEGVSGGGEIVFHSDWDDFPMLFYWNDKNYYIAGLDPTFLYLKNKDLYEKYIKITSGETKDNLREIVANDFKAKYVLIGKDHPKMRENISKDESFEEVYEDEEGWIYLSK